MGSGTYAEAVANTDAFLFGINWWDVDSALERLGPGEGKILICFYMTNLLASADPVRFTGKLFAPAEGGKVGMIDPRDTGAVAAVVLTNEGHEGQTYALSGPEAITYERVAEDLSAATGRPVEFVNVPDESLKQGLTEAGSPDWLVDHLSKLFGRIRNGDLEVVTDGVRALTGREPRSFAAWARDHASAFAG